MTRQKNDYENGNVTKPWTKARATNKELKRDFRKEKCVSCKSSISFKKLLCLFGEKIIYKRENGNKVEISQMIYLTFVG